MIRAAAVVSLSLLLLTPMVNWGADLPAPPTQQVLRIDSTGQWQMLLQAHVCKVETRVGTNTKKVPETKTIAEVVDGKPVQRTVTQYKEVVETFSYSVPITVYQTVAISVDPTSFKAYETDGRLIPAEKLRSRIQGETLVVVSATDEMIPDTYSQLFKPGTIILSNSVVRPPTPAPASISAPLPQPPQPAVVPRSTVPPTVLSTVPPVPAPAAKLPELSPSPAPVIAFLSRDGVDNLTLRRLAETTSPISALRTFTKGTIREKAPVQMMMTARLSETFHIAGNLLRFGMGSVGNLSLDPVKEKLARELAVVYSADGEDIDPFWLQNLKSTTLVVVGPQLPSGNGLAMPMTPMSGPMAPVAPATPVPVPAAPAPVPAP